MVGILITDEKDNIIFDGVQRIPKILVEYNVAQDSPLVHTVQLPYSLKGEVFCISSGGNTGEPYYNSTGVDFSYQLSTDKKSVILTHTGLNGRILSGHIVKIGEF